MAKQQGQQTSGQVDNPQTTGGQTINEQSGTQEQPPVQSEQPKICNNPRCFNNMENGEVKLDPIDLLLIEHIEKLLFDFKDEIISECRPKLGATTHRFSVEPTNKTYEPKKKQEVKPKKQ